MNELFKLSEHIFSTGPTFVGQPTIYAFDNTAGDGDWHSGVALAEDGECLSGHASSSYSWSRLDMGTPIEVETGRFFPAGPGVNKHESYLAHYPQGYIFEWIPREDVPTHAGLNAAFAKNQLIQVDDAKAEAVPNDS